MEAVLTLTICCGTLSSQGYAAATIDLDSETMPATMASAPLAGGPTNDTLTGDWGGTRSWLNEQGITLAPRFTQFLQGLPSGDGKHSLNYGAKADLLVNADLSKLGFWNGLSMTVHGEYNFGRNLNGFGGAIYPVNTALQFPRMDVFDLSSVYFQQTFGNSVSLIVGKINLMDFAASKPFMGGAGIDGFWNIAFVAPPSGTVPPYLLGALLNVRTEAATFGLWVYDPNSVVNSSGLEKPFGEGVTIRGTVDFPVIIAGRSGHQGLAASYSNKGGVDLETLGDTFLPPPGPQTVSIKNARHYFSYLFDQYLYQSKSNPAEGFGLFGQFGISDGNPNRLYWSILLGVGGVGLIPGRSRDNWGVGFYYAAPSRYLINSLAPTTTVRDEQGLEGFYNFVVTAGLKVGADVQVIKPSLGQSTAVFLGLRTVMNF